MHSIEAKRDLIEAPFAKVLSEVSSFVKADTCESLALTELENDKDIPLPLVDFLAPDELIAVQKLNQAALID